jgi:putative alpha-1,2-mannosidase
LAKLYGGNEKLVDKLQKLFNASSELHGKDVSMDISGLIGQYAHGNEPSHHIVYMFSVLGSRHLTIKYVKEICDKLYQTGPDGLSGNDDCGQMSAWYVWSVMGMYPMNPASGEYVCGMPMVDSVTINLPNGKQLRIRTKNTNKIISIRNVKLEKRHGDILWNGKKILKNHITHEQILKGGVLEFQYDFVPPVYDEKG